MSITKQTETEVFRHICVWTRDEMTTGIHRIRLKLRGDVCKNDYTAYHLGVIEIDDNLNCHKFNLRGNNGWLMDNYGRMGGNLKCDRESVGCEIGDGQIVSMEADLDKGTLRYMVDGKPWGMYLNGVKGRLRWAVCMCYKGSVVDIVTTGLDNV